MKSLKIKLSAFNTTFTRQAKYSSVTLKHSLLQASVSTILLLISINMKSLSTLIFGKKKKTNSEFLPV